MSFLPKTHKSRQGRRKRDRWGLCMECGTPTPFKCSSCERWRCVPYCTRLRKAPKRVGVYFLRCYPSCRRRMKPELVALLKTRVRRPGERRELFGAEVVAEQLRCPAPSELETPWEVLVAADENARPVESPTDVATPRRRLDQLTGPAVRLPDDPPYVHHGDTLPGWGRS